MVGGAREHAPVRTPLMGRDDELARFAELLASRRRGVVLHGSAGVGKTRLADELCALGAAAGFTTRFVSGRGSTTDIPLAPFASLLGPAVDATEGAPLLVAARTAVERLAAGAPLVLGVDDAHLLDAASATLVHQLVSSGHVVAVVTARDDEWAPQPIVELWRSGLLERWQVAGLDGATSVRVALDAMGEGADLVVAEEIARLSGGNPLLVTTLVQAAREGRGNVSDLVAAPGLADVVGSELRALSPEHRDALAVVALAEPIGVVLLEQLVEPSALMALERDRWIVVVEDERRVEVRLRHPLYGEVLRRTLSRMLARSVYGELARVVQATGARRRSDALRSAFWALEGGHSLPSAAMAQAARAALDAGDVDLSARFAEAVWDSGDEEHRFDAGLLLARTGTASATRSPGFGPDLAHAARGTGDRAALAVFTADVAFYGRADVEGALAALRRAAADITTGVAAGDPSADLARSATLLARQAAFVALRGDLAGAGRMLDAIDGDVSVCQESKALAVEAVVSTTGLPSEDAEAIVRWVDADPSARVDRVFGGMARRALLSGMSRWLVQRGRLHEAERWTREAADDAGACALLGGRPLTDRAWVLVWCGDCVGAMALARRAADRQRRLGLRLAERWSRLIVAFAACYAGDADTARDALGAVDALGPDPTTHRCGDEWYTRSMLAEVEGDLDLALRLAVDGAAEAAERGARFDETLGWLSVAWLDPTEQAAVRLDELAAEGGGVAALIAPYAWARVAADAAAMAEAAEAMEIAGTVSLSATIMQQAADVAAPTDARLAARLARRAAELHQGLSLGGPYAADVPLEPLSRRERDIAELAAAGWSSREIGERLFLSTRTVDNHLARVYDKLGVDGREELATVLAADVPQADTGRSGAGSPGRARSEGTNRS